MFTCKRSVMKYLLTTTKRLQCKAVSMLQLSCTGTNYYYACHDRTEAFCALILC